MKEHGETRPSADDCPVTSLVAPPPAERWCSRFTVDGTVPRLARDLLAVVRTAVPGDPALAELADGLGVLRAQQGSSTVSLLEDVLALRPLLWDQARAEHDDPALLLLVQARLAESLDAVLRHALDAFVAESQAVLRSLATHDPLTGLLNRSAFEEALHREVAGRGDRPALLMLDLDGFKAVNDTLGHLAGDEVLVGVARVLQAGVRASDAVARLGGDEFAVLLPSTSAVVGEHLARRLIALVESDPDLSDPRAPVGVSVGLARLEAPGSAGALVAAADEAMYQAKRNGGQRVVLAAGAA